MAGQQQAQDSQDRPNLTVSVGDDGIALITIDCPGQRQNVLGQELINQASRLLEDLQRDSSVRGLVFVSAKPGSFIAGADVRMIEACESADEVAALSRTGQRIFGQIEEFRAPVVAAIHGVCLGGGLELSLACHGRVCSTDPGTRLGLPEVKLGLLPGSGGTQRLPALVGLATSLDLMLTGRQVAAGKAQRIGLVDDAVPESILLEVARARVQALAGERRAPGGRPRGAAARVRQWLLEGTPAGRALVLSQARRKTRERTHGNYPAPDRIIDCVEEGLRRGRRQGFEREAREFGELAMTPQARQLMGLYFATTAQKKDLGVDDAAVKPRPVKRVAVLGGGLMGAGMAYVSADKAGVPVRLRDVKPEGLANARRHVRDQAQARRRRGSLTAFQASRVLHRVTGTLDYSGFRGVDLVMEAVFEDLELKQQMVREVERHSRRGVIFATNTSSIPISRIADGARRPARVVGMHYFSPVEKMPLLEVIPHAGTDPEVAATAVAFGRAQGKTPIVVGDCAGFYVNRILAPYLYEAMRLLGEGVAIDQVDRALVRFGFPVGPFKLLDEVGIDISAKVAPILHEAYGERMRPVQSTERMIAAGRLGRKSGSGFYDYSAGRHKGRRVDERVYDLLDVSPETAMDPDDIADRVVLPMLNEAARCLDENVLRSARDGDLGAIFGIGFPPFRGGPFRYMDRIGARLLVERLADYRERFGAHFAPAPVLESMASEWGRFHPD